MRVAFLAKIVSLPAYILFSLMPNAASAIAVSALDSFVYPGLWADDAAHQIITPNQMRGQMTALYLFIFNIIGFGLVRPLSRCYDYVFGAESQIGYSLSSTAVFLAPLGAAGHLAWPEALSIAQAWSWV